MPPEAPAVVNPTTRATMAPRRAPTGHSIEYSYVYAANGAQTSKRFFPKKGAWDMTAFELRRDVADNFGVDEPIHTIRLYTNSYPPVRRKKFSVEFTLRSYDNPEFVLVMQDLRSFIEVTQFKKPVDSVSLFLEFSHYREENISCTS